MTPSDTRPATRSCARSVRSCGVIRPYDLAARYGGEEFALLLPDTGVEAALAFAERVRLAIASHPWPLRRVTASLGLATARAGAPGSSVLLAQADAALYAAKCSGRDRVVHHDAPQRPAALPAAPSATALRPVRDVLDDRRNGKRPPVESRLGVAGNGTAAGGSHRAAEGPAYTVLSTHLPACNDLEVGSPFEIDPVAVAALPGSAAASELMAVVGALLRADRAERELQRVRGDGGAASRAGRRARASLRRDHRRLGPALELRDYVTEGHSRRVTELTVRVARRMGFDEPALVHVRRGALLHDIGKVGVPDAILSKPGPLDEAEWSVMRRHPELAYQMLAPIGFLKGALEIPYSHHERWDGTGYPRGLRGEQIPRSADLRGGGYLRCPEPRPPLSRGVAPGAREGTPPVAGRHSPRARRDRGVPRRHLSQPSGVSGYSLTLTPPKHVRADKPGPALQLLSAFSLSDIGLFLTNQCCFRMVVPDDA